jgi:hypothetical protein
MNSEKFSKFDLGFHLFQELSQIISEYTHVLFADVCKEGATPLSGHIVKYFRVLLLAITTFSEFIFSFFLFYRLQSDALLPSHWRLVAAQRTYNPLGSIITFLNKADVKWEVLRLVHGSEYITAHKSAMEAERQL